MWLRKFMHTCLAKEALRRKWMSDFLSAFVVGRASVMKHSSGAQFRTCQLTYISTAFMYPFFKFTHAVLSHTFCSSADPLELIHKVGVLIPNCCVKLVLSTRGNLV